MCARYGYGRSIEMVARKISDTNFGTETPSKQRRTISSVQPTDPSTPTNLATSPMGQIQQKYHQIRTKQSLLYTTYVNYPLSLSNL